MVIKKKIDRGVIFEIVVFVIIVIGVAAGLGFNIGKQIGENIGKTMACQLDTTYIPPMFCYEITHSPDGYRCCNWNETVLQCGRPLLQIK